MYAAQTDPAKQPVVAEWAAGQHALTGPSANTYLVADRGILNTPDAQGVVYALVQCPAGGSTNQYICGFGDGESGWRLRLNSSHSPTTTYVNSQVGGQGYAYAYDTAQKGSRRLVELIRNGSHVTLTVYDLAGVAVGSAYTAALVYNPAPATAKLWLLGMNSNATRYEGLLRAFRFYEGALSHTQRAAARAELLEDAEPQLVLRDNLYVTRMDGLLGELAPTVPDPYVLPNGAALVFAEDGTVNWQRT